MLEKEQKKILFIINPKSGIGRQKVIEGAISENIDKQKYIYEIVYSEYHGHSTIIAKEAIEKGFSVITAIGGDGSINEIAKSIIGTDVALAIIPAGSGNGLARHLKIPFNPASAIKRINEFKTISIDTIEINKEIFVSIAGVGFDAKVAKLYTTTVNRGFWAYFKIVAKEYFNYRPKKYILNIDGKIIEKRALLICFANSSQFGYNTVIAPEASLTDGLIDVCVFTKPSFYMTPFVVSLLKLNMIDKSKYIDIIKAQHIILERKRNRPVNIDGESMKLGAKLDIQIKPNSLKVVV